MPKRIVFRNMDHSDAIEQYANEQLERIEHFLEGENSPIYIDLTLEPSKVHNHHRVELRVKTPNYDRITEFEGNHFYKILDHVTDVMYKELHEDKKKHKIDGLKTTGRHDDFKKQR